ncbi:hypothetical protein [Microtetraspora sp. NBRC 16547]|uniref:hypothetical protein n=1 Tax=Microtetraspora sp. NBRC 16547 TaxID=3030993 RepID=UPI0024A200EB|nr:hypothetical protein [Microtetraspora sp. NBRC 16547]GLX02775.1 hypothetical protein Misp02_68610 [Microtetraspora sp. NBRC 16547]
MTKRSFVLAVLAAAVLAAPTAASAASGFSGAEVSSYSSAAVTTTFSFRGMNLQIPAGWKVHRDGDGVVVVTGKCDKPEPFAPNCQGFWVFGPKAFTNLPVGGGSLTYTGKAQFYPFSGVVSCPFNAKTGWYPGEKPTSTGLRQVGRGHKAKYTVWPNQCVTNNGGKRTASFTQQEWFLPASKILVVDVWNTPKLSDVLTHATWS